MKNYCFTKTVFSPGGRHGGFGSSEILNEVPGSPFPDSNLAVPVVGPQTLKGGKFCDVVYLKVKTVDKLPMK